VAVAAGYEVCRCLIEVIGYAVWRYQRFALSVCDVEELVLARGVVVSCEMMRSWCAKFGPNYAARLCLRRPRPGDKWHLDEVFVKINGTSAISGPTVHNIVDLPVRALPLLSRYRDPSKHWRVGEANPHRRYTPYHIRMVRYVPTVG
jgi:hypothetical protein